MSDLFAQLETGGVVERVTAAMSPEVEGLIGLSAPVIFCVSGGKDSRLAAEVATEELDRLGYNGPRILMHADVGKRMVWGDAEEQCDKLAARLGLKLEIVKREASDLLDRWLVRWANNVSRYAALECVRLILPFSTPSMPFCTSELKTAVMYRKSKQLFPKQPVMQVLGIRCDESKSKTSGRGKAPVS
jgi:3'-phosphoadenosine 5'-phosphosulfate sulfotransferase (PAPS reductase)/FAD synthetase